MELFNMTLVESTELLQKCSYTLVQETKQIKQDYLAIVSQSKPIDYEDLLSNFFVRNKELAIQQMKNDISRREYLPRYRQQIEEIRQIERELRHIENLHLQQKNDPLHQLMANVTPVFQRTSDGKILIPKNQLRVVDKKNSFEFQMRRKVLEGFATKIQRAYRKHSWRRIKIQKKAVDLISNIYYAYKRRKLTEAIWEEYSNSAIKLQRWYRSLVQKKRKNVIRGLVFLQLSINNCQLRFAIERLKKVKAMKDALREKADLLYRVNKGSVNNSQRYISKRELIHIKEEEGKFAMAAYYHATKMKVRCLLSWIYSHRD